MMTQEQMEIEIMKLKMENNEIKEIILEMQQQIKETVSLLEHVAVLMTSRK